MSGPTRQRSFRDRLHGIGLSWQGKRSDSCKTAHSCSVSSASSFDCHGYVNPLELVLDAKEGGSSAKGGESRPCKVQPPDTGEYVVKADDTLAGIAARFECTPGELTVLNKLTTRLIFPGQVLYVPLHGPSAAGAPTIAPSTPPGAEQYLKVNSRHITDGQGVVSGMLLVTPNKLMFIPNVSDPLVVEHGSEIYEVSAPMELVVAAALYHDIAHMRVQHRQPSDKTPKAEVFRLPPLDDHPVAQQCSPGLGETQNLADEHKDVDQKSARKSEQGRNDSQSFLPEIEAPSAVSHRVGIPFRVPLQTIRVQTTITEGVSPLAEADRGLSPKAQSVIVKSPQGKEPQSDSVATKVMPSEFPHTDLPQGASKSAAEILRVEAHQADKGAVADGHESESVVTTISAAAPSGAESCLPQHLEVVSVEKDSVCAASQEDLSVKQNLSKNAGSIFCDEASNMTNDSVLLSSSAKSDDPVQAANLAENKEKLGETVEESSGRALEDGLAALPKKEAKHRLPGSPGGTLTYNMWLKNMVEEKPELFAALEKLVPRPAQASEAPLLYLCVRMGKPPGGTRDPRLHSQYWFGIPRPRVEEVYRFLEKWAPSVYGDVEEADPSARGLELFEDDDSPEPATTSTGGESSSSATPTSVVAPSTGARIIGGPLRFLRFFEGATEHADWEPAPTEAPAAEVVPVEEVPLPEMLEPSEILADEHRRQLCKHLPARAESYSWALLYSSLRDGFSLKTLYREMGTYEGPVLLVVLDTQGTMFGASASCPLRISDHFYGTGESFLFTFHPRFRAYHWTGDNTYFIKGNADSVAFGAGDGQFGLWLDGDLFHGRSRCCQTFCNQVLSQKEDFVVKAIEAWGFV